MIFSTLLILIDVLIKLIPANPLGSATQLIEHSKALSLVLRLAPFAGIAFLWFIAAIRDHLGIREDRFFCNRLPGKRVGIPGHDTCLRSDCTGTFASLGN